MSYLSFKARTEKEIVDKLKQKGYNDNSIEYALNKLKEYNLIDDYAYGKAYIQDRQNFKKAGKRLIKQELILKGIDKELIDQLIEENVDEEEEYRRAIEIAEKKIKSLKGKDRNTIYRRLSGLLARKGYSFDIISKICKELL